MSALVPMLFSRQEAAREAATEAVAALCSYHQEGKLAYLEGLVQEVLQRQRGASQQQGAAEVGGWAGGGRAGDLVVTWLRGCLHAWVRAAGRRQSHCRAPGPACRIQHSSGWACLSTPACVTLRLFPN